MTRKRSVIDLVSPQIQRQVVSYSLRFPSHKETHIKAAMKEQGMRVSNAEIRSVWQKNHLEEFTQRLTAMERVVKSDAVAVA